MTTFFSSWRSLWGGQICLEIHQLFKCLICDRCSQIQDHSWFSRGPEDVSRGFLTALCNHLYHLSSLRILHPYDAKSKPCESLLPSMTKYIPQHPTGVIHHTANQDCPVGQITHKRQWKDGQLLFYFQSEPTHPPRNYGSPPRRTPRL